MKTWYLSVRRMFPICAGIILTANLYAAPLTWFPGPPLYNPVSGAMAVTSSGYGNVVIGGTSYYSGVSYPQYLIATNAYWGGMIPMYSVNIAGGAVNGGDFIIVYGGTDGTASESSVTAYSPSGDTPPTYASMSVPRSYLGYAGDRSGNAYAIGGLDGSGQPLASAEKFSSESGASGTWSAIASLPQPRYDFPAVSDNTNSIYIFGGYNDIVSGVELASVMRYSTSKNTWTNLASLPVPVAGSAATMGADGNIYVVGGLSGGAPVNVVQVYNPAANSWTVSTPLPESLNASAMSVDSLGRLIVMGGMDTNGYDTGDVWRSQQLGVPDSAPVFTAFPGTSATYRGSYSSIISATGNPQPTFQLINGPAGMAVDTYSGAITWSPQGVSEIGVIPVTIQAANFAGTTNYNFTITVPNPPPAAPTNLVVSSVTDNSVTLSWGPEDPAVGLTTYTVAIPHPYHSPRGSGGGVNYQILVSGITGTSVTIGGLAPSSSTALDVKATAPGGTSAYVGVTAFTTGPQGPTNVWVTGLTSTSVSLAWTPSAGADANPRYSPITSYAIMERIASTAQNIPTVTNIMGTNGTVTGLTPGSSHIWFISGVDAQGTYSPLTWYYVVVANPVPAAAHLTSVAPAGSITSGNSGFTFSAAAGASGLQTVFIQATTNPLDPNAWVQIGTVTPTNNPFTFTDTNAGQFPVRFYRIVSP